MGCNASSLDGNIITLPLRLRPLFHQRLNEIKARRHGMGPLKDSTPSKKELLHDHKDDEDNISSYISSLNVSERVVYLPEEVDKKEPEKHREEAPKEKRSTQNNENDTKVSQLDDAKAENIEQEGENCEEYENKEGEMKESNENIENEMTDTDYDDEDDERNIGHEDDESFPGSPSFRVYFKDEGEYDHNAIGKNVAIKEATSSDDGLSSKESHNKKVKKGRKKRSFRLPKGGQAAMKNLLNVKSCYTSHCSHSHTRLLAEKSPLDFQSSR